MNIACQFLQLGHSGYLRAAEVVTVLHMNVTDAIFVSERLCSSKRTVDSRPPRLGLLTNSRRTRLTPTSFFPLSLHLLLYSHSLAPAAPTSWTQNALEALRIRCRSGRKSRATW